MFFGVFIVLTAWFAVSNFAKACACISEMPHDPFVMSLLATWEVGWTVLQVHLLRLYVRLFKLHLRLVRGEDE
jgi:hypothetical protein